MRIAVMFDNLGPYHIARLANAAKRCDLTALEIRAKSVDYQWDAAESVGFKRRTLFRESEADDVRFRHACKVIESALVDDRIEVLVVPGWSSSFAIAGVIVANRRGIPTMVMSESQEVDFERTPLRELVKRRYLTFCRSAVVGGTPQRDYLLKLGMPPARVRTGYDVVDNAYFAVGSAEARTNSAALRAKHRLPRPFFLASSRFIQKKNLDTLIRAFGDYRRRAIRDRQSDTECWDLVILGDGALRPNLEALVQELGLREAVHMPGFVQYPELPEFYGLAGAFVHASTSEQWGLVVNEAMASGLPVLVSEPCGCARDLVEAGRNGFTFDPEDEGELARLMYLVAGVGVDRESMGAESRRIIALWSLDNFGESLVAAAEVALSFGAPRMGLLDSALLRLLGRYSERFRPDDASAEARVAPKAAVRDFFDSQAECYAKNFLDLKRGGNYRFFRRLEVACEYSSRVGGRLLDCAIGSGEVTAAVLRAGRFAEADLVDISNNMLAKGREHVESLKLGVACNYIEDDIFRFARSAADMGRKYDVILCLGLIAHVGRLEELLMLLRPLMVEGTGRLLLQSTLTDHIGVGLVRMLTEDRYKSRKRYAISYFSRADIAHAAATCGFDICAETRFGLMIPFGDRLWPWANFHAERLGRSVGHRSGGEAIFALAARDERQAAAGTRTGAS